MFKFWLLEDVGFVLCGLVGNYSFSSIVLIVVMMLVMCVTNNMRGWCQELMRTLGGPSCRGMHVL